MARPSLMPRFGQIGHGSGLLLFCCLSIYCTSYTVSFISNFLRFFLVLSFATFHVSYHDESAFAGPIDFFIIMGMGSTQLERSSLDSKRAFCVCISPFFFTFESSHTSNRELQHSNHNTRDFSSFSQYLFRSIGGGSHGTFWLVGVSRD